MKNLSPVNAIRIYCKECSGNSPKEVKLCPIEDCPLYQFRFGKNPNRTGMGGKGFPKEFVKKTLAESGDFTNKGKVGCIDMTDSQCRLEEVSPVDFFGFVDKVEQSRA